MFFFILFYLLQNALKMPSLLEALELKYGSTTNDCSECSLTDEENELSVSPKTALSVSIFIPKKSPRHTVPALLVLQDCDIECAGNDAEKLRNKCKNVEELDLAQNKLTEWNQVIEILQHMPKIKFVNLSFNNLAENILIENKKFSSLKNLVLNGTRVSWLTVQELVRLLDNIEELHLSLNEFKTVELDYRKPDDINKSLKKLHFTGNPIDNWNEISKFGYAFPNLESLVLAECPIKSLCLEDHKIFNDDNPSFIRIKKEDENENLERNGKDMENDKIFDKDDEKVFNNFQCGSENCEIKQTSTHDPFKMLRFLNVNGTLLSTWDDVEKLARFPALKSLRMQGCPLFEVILNIKNIFSFLFFHAQNDDCYNYYYPG